MVNTTASKITFPIVISTLLLVGCASVVCQQPELVVRTGHPTGVHALAFSPDGLRLASAGTKTVRLWDVEKGIELREFSAIARDIKSKPTEFGEFESVAFSPDGHTVAAAGWGNRTRQWDLATGEDLRTKATDSLFHQESVVFSPDGKMLATEDKSDIYLWNRVSDRLSRRIVKSEDLRNVLSSGGLTFSPDGRLLASYRDHFVNLWDVTSGKLVKTLAGTNSSYITSIAFTSDSKQLAMASNDYKITIFDVSNGRSLVTLSGHTDFVSGLVFKGEDNVLFSSSFDRTIRVWEGTKHTTSRVIRNFTKEVMCLAFSPKNNILASCSGSTISLTDGETGTHLRELVGHSYRVHNLSISPDGTTVASTGGPTLKLWDLYGSTLQTLPFPDVFSVAFSKNGKLLAAGSYDGAIKIWDYPELKEHRPFPVQPGKIFSLAFSPKGDILATGISNFEEDPERVVKLWNVTSGDQICTVETGNYWYMPLGFSADGTTIAIGNRNHLELRDVTNCKKLRTMDHKWIPIFAVAFGPDGNTIATAHHEVKLWRISTGRQFRAISHPRNDFIYSLAFSRDGKLLAVGSSDTTVRVISVQSGETLALMRGHTAAVMSLAFTPDGKHLVSGSSDGSLKVWDLRSHKQLLTMIGIDRDDWLVTTPDQLFDGSSAGFRQVIWRFNGRTFDYAPAEAFFNDFYHPSLLNDIFSGKRPKAPRNLAQLDRRSPRVALSLGVPAAPAGTARTVTVRVDVHESHIPLQELNQSSIAVRPRRALESRSKARPHGSGARDIRVFRNGNLVKLWQGDAFALGEKDGCKVSTLMNGESERRVTCELTLPITYGKNILTAYAFNRDNIKSLDADPLSIVGTEKREETTFILAIGINNYASPGCKLNYARQDAEVFADRIKQEQLRLGVTADRIRIIPLYDQQARKENILRELDVLAQVVQPEDTLIIFFAGHGIAEGARFFLIPSDLGIAAGRCDQLTAKDFEQIKAHSITDLDLESALRKIDAGRTLLVLDSCNSGQVLESEEKRRGPMNSKGLAQLAYEKGMFVMAASQSYEAAQERKNEGHGLLTFVLTKDALNSPEVDKIPKDQQIEIREWLDYATWRVPQIQERENRKKGRAVGIQSAVTQHPRVFYRRELLPKSWIIASR